MTARVALQLRTREDKGLHRPPYHVCWYRSKLSHKMRGTSPFRRTTGSCQYVSYRMAASTYLPKLVLRQLFDTGLLLCYPFCQRQQRLTRFFDQAEHFFGTVRPIESRDEVPAFRMIQMLAIPVDDFHARLATGLCDFPQSTNHGRVWFHDTIPPLNRDLGGTLELVRRPWLCRQGRINPPRT